MNRVSLVDSQMCYKLDKGVWLFVTSQSIGRKAFVLCGGQIGLMDLLWPGLGCMLLCGGGCLLCMQIE